MKGFRNDRDVVNMLEELQEQQCDRWICSLLALALAHSSLAEVLMQFMPRKIRVLCIQSTGIIWDIHCTALCRDPHVC